MTSPRVKPRGKVFRDPVHRLIRVEPGDDFILDLIDTSIFQRLRRVRQLGVSWLTYHGAEHSRFSHSLGVFNFAQRILRALAERYRDTEVEHYLIEHFKELKAAALLHDIGHAPFSHMLERAFEDSPSHEDVTVKLIRNEPISSILRSAGVDCAKVAEIIEGTSEHQLIKDIVSSQLDADRMDYLLRDSLFTGVEYGKYDAEWIVRNLCVGRDPSSPSVSSDADSVARLRLSLDQDRGLHSAEQMIIARLHMTMQVYMHRVTRGYETLILNMFKLAAGLAVDGHLPNGTPQIVVEYFKNKGDLSCDRWADFDEMAMFAAFSAWSKAKRSTTEHLSTLASAFLQRERLYSVRMINPSLGMKEANSLSEDLGAIGKQGLVWEWDEGNVMPYKGLLYSASKPKRDAEEQSAESILLSSGDIDSRCVAVDTVSKIFRSLDFEGQRFCRLYFDRSKEQEVQDVLDRHKDAQLS